MRFNFFVAKLTKKTGQTTLEGGESGSAGRRELKKVIAFQRTMTTVKPRYLAPR